jgi:hypothetical protein
MVTKADETPTIPSDAELAIWQTDTVWLIGSLREGTMKDAPMSLCIARKKWATERQDFLAQSIFLNY